MTAPFTYDTISYPTHPMRESHPDRLFVIGRLFGLSPAPVATCRLLDVGCGSGEHLIAAALTLPGARIVGLDLSAAAIRRGQELAAAAGVGNVELRHADLMEYNPPPGSFDYVTAHGFYSWVPLPVRDRLLTVTRTALTSNGIGYISFNTYPGCFIRRMIWEMAKYHIRGSDDPEEQLAEARAFFELLGNGQLRPDELAAQLVKKETGRLLAVKDMGEIYHDDLGAVNDPCYLHEFADHLGGYGFQFVADALAFTMQEGRFPPAVAAILNGMRETDLVWKEQYIDFLMLRRFRHTVFARAGCGSTSAPQATAVPEFVVGLTAGLEVDRFDLAPGVPVTFRNAERGTMTVKHPLAKAVFLQLTQQGQGRLPFAELAALAASQAGVTVDDRGRAELAQVLLAAHLSGPVEFFAHVPPVATEPGERPLASPLVRAQLRGGKLVSTLWHSTITIEDEAVRALVGLCDGTRDRSALAVELETRIPGAADVLDEMLQHLARAGLLIHDSRR